MAIVRYPLRAAALAPLLLGTALVAPGAAQQRVGVSSAVNPDVTGIPPNAAPRRLVLGQDVVFRERITTGPEGQTQVLFVDQSSMTVGPNSDMVIDEFVYDPNAGAGKLAASLTRGVFRYVGGKLSKQDNAVTFQTPSATIGIRGGLILVDLAPDGRLQVIFGYGNGVTITGLNGISQTITRPGFQVTVAGRGAAPVGSRPGASRAPPRQSWRSSTASPAARAARGRSRPTPWSPTAASLRRFPGMSWRALRPRHSSSRQEWAASSSKPPRPCSFPPIRARLPTRRNSYLHRHPRPLRHHLRHRPPRRHLRRRLLHFRRRRRRLPRYRRRRHRRRRHRRLRYRLHRRRRLRYRRRPHPPVVISYAGLTKTTPGTGTALTQGFIAQGPTNRIPYTNGAVTFPVGQPAAGVFTATFDVSGTPAMVQFPLAPGSTSPGFRNFGPDGTQSPFGPVTGTSYMAPDSTFFYANLTPADPALQAERGFIFGGQAVPATSPLLSTAPSTTQLYTFALQPDAALQSPVPFVTQSTGGNYHQCQRFALLRRRSGRDRCSRGLIRPPTPTGRLPGHCRRAWESMGRERARHRPS